MADLPVGSGGRAREKKIDQYVDSAVNGNGNQSQTPTVTPGPKAKVPYVPSDKEKKTRQYGAPIQPPIARMRDGQSTDSYNRYV